MFLFPATASLAEDRPTTQGTELVMQQQFTKKQFDALTKTMMELADMLEKSDPESARAIRQAVAQAQGAFIDKDMDQVVELLSRGLPGRAAGTESKVIDELRNVLQALRQGTVSLDERLERIKKWKEFLSQILKLRQEEDRLRQQSQQTAQGSNDSKAADLLARLADITTRQKQLLAGTEALNVDANAQRLGQLLQDLRDAQGQQSRVAAALADTPVDKLPVTGAVQEKLSAQTQSLAKKLEAAAKDADLAKALSAAGADANSLPAASASAASAAAEMAKAAAALAKSEPADASAPQEQAAADLKAAEAALAAAVEKLSASTPAAALAGQQKELQAKTQDLAKATDDLAAEAGIDPNTLASASETQPASSPAPASRPGGAPHGPDNLARAASQMDQAAQDLGQSNAGGAQGHQKKALEELEGKKYHLAQLQRRMKESKPDPLDKQKADQDKAADQTDDLGGRMDKSESASAAKATPGKASLADAGKSMKQASGQLSEGQAQPANDSQKKAVVDLDKTKQDLEEAIAREEELAKAEQLARIDQLLERMLKTQQGIGDRTQAAAAKLAELRAAGKTDLRAVELELAQLASGEGTLADDAQNVLNLLKKEGASVVFPDMLQQVRADLLDVQKRLAAQQAGGLTQAIQQEVQASLQDMLDAIRKELADRRAKAAGGGGGGGGGGGAGGQPLVPPVAELKLLRTLQLQINSRTAVLDQERQLGALPKSEIEGQHAALAARQAKLVRLAQEISRRLAAHGGDHEE